MHQEARHFKFVIPPLARGVEIKPISKIDIKPILEIKLALEIRSQH